LNNLNTVSSSVMEVAYSSSFPQSRIGLYTGDWLVAIDVVHCVLISFATWQSLHTVRLFFLVIYCFTRRIAMLSLQDPFFSHGTEQSHRFNQFIHHQFVPHNPKCEAGTTPQGASYQLVVRTSPRKYYRSWGMPTMILGCVSKERGRN